MRIDPKWVVFAISSYVLWIFCAAAFFTNWNLPFLSFDETIGTVASLAFASSIGLSFLVYNLISRENRHAEREQEIGQELVVLAHPENPHKSTSLLLSISSTEQDLSNFINKSREHSAILWSLLVMIPYGGWVFLMIALYLLTQSSNNHEKLETVLLEDFDRTLTAAGVQHAPIGNRPPHLRNGVAFLVGSIVTAGIVAWSWLYVMIIGEDAHFSYHSIIESELLRALPGLSEGIGRVS